MSRVQTFQPEPSFPAAQTVAPERVPLHLRDSFLGRRQIRCLRSATRQKTETYFSWKFSFWPPPRTISTGLSSECRCTLSHRDFRVPFLGSVNPSPSGDGMR